MVAGLSLPVKLAVPPFSVLVFSPLTNITMTSQLHKKGEAWSARFNEPMSDLVKRYTSSVFFDKRLALVDTQGSLALTALLAA